MNNYSRRKFIGGVATIAGSMGSIGTLGGPVAAAAIEHELALVELRNDALAVFIDPKSGRIARIDNYLTHEVYEVSSIEFAIVSNRETRSSDQMTVTGIRRKGDHVEVLMRGGGYRASLHYQLGGQWLEKWVIFSVAEPVILQRVVMSDRQYSSAFEEHHFHSDNTAYDVPICSFLRSRRGGLYAGIEFPFTSSDFREQHLRLSYAGWRSRYDFSDRQLVDMPGNRPSEVGLADMNVNLNPGDSFVSEKEFLGVFQRTGYLRTKALTGTPRILTTVEERLDWGEVWAMQRFMRHVLPPLPKNYAGFELYMNGWWAGLPGEAIQSKDLDAYKRAIDESVTLGVGAFSFPSTWLGMAKFIDRSAPFIETLGEHGNFNLSPAAREAVDYVRNSGLTLASLSEGSSFYRKDRPDWKTVTVGGTKRGELCWANVEAIEWFCDLHKHAFTKSPAIKYWNWDGGFLPGDPEDAAAELGEEPLTWECYSKAHGHPPGNVSFRLYKNVMSFFRRLRTECPDIATIVAWAVKCGGPWALRYVDSHENFYENQGPDDLRFQFWYNQNSSFVPCEKNMAQVWFSFNPSAMHLPEKSREYWKMWYTDRRRDYEYGFMSALSGGVDLGYLVQLPQFASEDDKGKYIAFVAKWKRWATENLSCLKVKRDLFGQPLREGGIDGSAHVESGRGFVFLFNPTSERHIGRIGLDERVYLTPGTDYLVKCIYPDDNQSLGSYAYGESVTVDLPAGACRLLEIHPYGGLPLPKERPSGADIQDAF